MNPMVKQARMAALRMLAGHTVGDVQPIGNLQVLHQQAAPNLNPMPPTPAAGHIPLSTNAGLKESETKKFKLKP